MAKYPLGPLLSAREFREDLAAREARRARDAAEDARAAAAAAREELERYREWRPGEERRLFELLRGQNIPRSGLDKHLRDIQQLRDAEWRREDEVKKAEKARLDAEAAAEAAKQRQLKAARDRRKIEEHRGRWQKAEDSRVDALEELELEDFSKRGGLDDDAG